MSRFPSVRRFSFAAVTALLVVVSPHVPWAAHASAGVVEEYQVKAAFVLNLLKFVEWPQHGDATVVGVAGESPIEAELSRLLHGRSLDGRTLGVRRVAVDVDPGVVQLLFIPVSEARRTSALLARVSSRPVLVVGETPLFLKEGGAVRFLIDGHRVRFQINAAAAERVGLRVPAQLLGLAVPSPSTQ